MRQQEFVEAVVKILFKRDNLQNTFESYLYRIEDLDKFHVKLTTKLAIATVLVGSRRIEMYVEALKLLISTPVSNNISSTRTNSYHWVLKELIHIVFDYQLHCRDELIQDVIPENMLNKQSRMKELTSQLNDTFNYIKLEAPKQCINEILLPIYDEYNNLIHQEDLQEWARWLRSLYFLKENRRINDFVPWVLQWMCGLLVESMHSEKIQEKQGMQSIQRSHNYKALMEEKNNDSSSSDDSSTWSNENENHNMNEDEVNMIYLSSNNYLSYVMDFMYHVGNALYKYFQVKNQ